MVTALRKLNCSFLGRNMNKHLSAVHSSSVRCLHAWCDGRGDLDFEYTFILYVYCHRLKPLSRCDSCIANNTHLWWWNYDLPVCFNRSSAFLLTLQHVNRFSLPSTHFILSLFSLSQTSLSLLAFKHNCTSSFFPSFFALNFSHTFELQSQKMFSQ